MKTHQRYALDSIATIQDSVEVLSDAVLGLTEEVEKLTRANKRQRREIERLRKALRDRGVDRLNLEPYVDVKGYRQVTK